MGKRGSNPFATTGVELSFTIQTSASLQIKAITAAEIEAKQREDEAAAAAAAAKRQEEEARLSRIRHQLLSVTLKQCRKAHSKHKRVRCEKRAKKKYGSADSR